MRRWILALAAVWMSVAGALAQSVEGLIAEGAEHLAEARFAEAAAAYEQALALAPDSYEAALGLFDTFMLKRPMTLGDRLDATERVLNQLLALRPTAEETLIAQARWLNTLGDADAAIPLMEGALAANPNSLPVLLQLARLKLPSDPAQARPLMDRAQALDPENSDLWVLEGLYHLWANDDRYTQIDALDRAIALNPRNWSAYSNRITAFWFTGQWDLMLRDARVLEPRWGDPLIYGNLALAMLNVGMFADGAAAAQRAIDVTLSIGATPNAVRINDLAENLIGLGDYAGAAAAWDSFYAVESNLSSPFNMDNAAMVYYRAGQYQRALELFERKVASEGEWAIFRDDHIAAFEALQTCAAVGNCPPALPDRGLLTRGQVAEGAVGFRHSVWSFEAAAGETISLAVTVTEPVTVELAGVASDGTPYPIWTGQAHPDRPFVLRQITLPADATYRVRVGGFGLERYKILVVNA
ncbi:MAG: tetratricopeptide repeat protein [Anaerolineae bacterium]